MSLEDLYLNTTVPLPSAPLKITAEDTHGDACGKLDDYFDDLVRKYPRDIRIMLGDMYYNSAGLIIEEGMLEKTRRRGHCELARKEGDEDGYCAIRIDAHIYECPLLLRCTKIHEIAGHAGQMAERVEKIGYDAWKKEADSGAFTRFTEQSIAPAEKMMFDALPSDLLGEDLDFMMDQKARGDVALFIMRDRAMAYDDYTRLKHTPETTPITEQDHQLLHSRLDLAAFRRVMVKEYPHSFPQRKKAFTP
jgi:hypothetical protein